MPLVFKSEVQEPIKLEREGATFYFRPTESLKRQSSLNILSKGKSGWGDYCNELFREALVGWNDLVDEDGKDIPFSIDTRNALIDMPDLFSDTDLIEVCKERGVSEGENGPKKPTPKMRKPLPLSNKSVKKESGSKKP